MRQSSGGETHTQPQLYTNRTLASYPSEHVPLVPSRLHNPGGMEAPTTACIRGCCTSTAVRLDVNRHEDLGAADWQPLAVGGTSRVMQGTYRGQPVAVKLPCLPKQDDLGRFHKELQMMLTVDHPHIVPLLAARAHPPDYCFVLPLMHCNLAQVEWPLGQLRATCARIGTTYIPRSVEATRVSVLGRTPAPHHRPREDVSPTLQTLQDPILLKGSKH
jgi:hypothetical protein